MIVEKKVKKNLDKIYNAALSAANPINCVGKFLEEKAQENPDLPKD